MNVKEGGILFAKHIIEQLVIRQSKIDGFQPAMVLQEVELNPRFAVELGDPETQDVEQHARLGSCDSV